MRLAFFSLNLLAVGICSLNLLAVSICSLNLLAVSICSLNLLAVSICSLNLLAVSICSLNLLAVGILHFLVGDALSLVACGMEGSNSTISFMSQRGGYHKNRLPNRGVITPNKN